MRRRPLPLWRVVVAGHTVARWTIGDEVLEVRAINEVGARVEATRAVHRAAGVAPWRPWLRFTYLRTSATPVQETDRAAVGGHSR
jgi:hypothetical protein